MVRRRTFHGDQAEALEACLAWVRGAVGSTLWADGPAGGHAPLHRPARPPPARDAGLDPAGALARMAQEVAVCERCTLCETRTQTVFGVGTPTPRLVIIGEAPGAEEDRRGEPFVGAAGQLLDRMLAAIGLDRTQIYIGNLLKCRPPGNRDPRPDEVGACKSWLDAQLEALAPDVILALGTPAVRSLLGTNRGITSLRGRFARSVQGYRVMPSFHPAYLLRNPAAKREAWEDLKKVAGDLGLEIPGR